MVVVDVVVVRRARRWRRKVGGRMGRGEGWWSARVVVRENMVARECLRCGRLLFERFQDGIV